MPAGRPTSYKKEYAKQVEKLCRLGATNRELSDFFGVSGKTLWNWSVQYPEFLHALKVGQEAANVRVSRSLYHKALGYDYVEQQAIKLRTKQGNDYKERVEVVELNKHCPADTTAIKFWLVNKDQANWRDVNRTELTGKDGEPLDASGLSTAEVKQLRDLVAKASQPRDKAKT